MNTTTTTTTELMVEATADGIRIKELEEERDELQTKVAVLEYELEQLRAQLKPVKVDAKPVAVSISPDAELDTQILHFLKITPGSTVKALAKSLVLDKKAINSKLYKMKDKQIVQIGLDGTAPMWAVK